MMDCPLGLDKVHCSSCYFWWDGKCDYDPLPRPLVRVMAGAPDKILACPGSHQWVKLLDDKELNILELHIRELGLQEIPAALLRKVVWEKQRRRFPATPPFQGIDSERANR